MDTVMKCAIFAVIFCLAAASTAAAADRLRLGRDGSAALHMLAIEKNRVAAVERK